MDIFSSFPLLWRGRNGKMGQTHVSSNLFITYGMRFLVYDEMELMS